MAGLMMSAILSDTVLFKSPTCTPRDKTAVEKPARITGVDPMKFGMELLKAKSNMSSKFAKDILLGDFKKFDFSGTRSGVGQVEVMDLADLAPKRAAILDEMNKMKEAEELDMVVLVLTDVMNEASDLLFVGNAAAAAGFEKAFGGKLANNSIYKEKCLSRKKQVIPPLEDAFKKKKERQMKITQASAMMEAGNDSKRLISSATLLANILHDAAPPEREKRSRRDYSLQCNPPIAKLFDHSHPCQ
jgi:manganese-dependent inorganic pyrophosphatase